MLACVDQGCCGWEQHKAGAGGCVAPSCLCRVQKAPKLCMAQQVWCGGLCAAFIPAQALAEDKLPPCAFCFLALQHGAHLLPLCCWSMISFFLGLATLLVGTAFGKDQLEWNSNAQSKIFAVRSPRAILCHRDVSWDVW